MNPLSDTPRARITIRGEADPQLPARVLGLITGSGELPALFCARLEASGCFLIELDRVGADADAVHRFVQRLLRIPTVISAEAVLEAPPAGLDPEHLPARA